MVQVLQGAPKKKTFGQKLAGGLERALPIAQQMMGQYQSNQLAKNQNEALGRINPELAGLNPDLQKIGLQQHYQGENESQKRANQLQGNTQIIRNLESQFGLQEGALEAYKENPQMALNVIKANQEKTMGGLGGQQVPQEFSQAMSQIVEQNPKATADQLKGLMDKAKIPPSYSNPYVENRRQEQDRTSREKEKRVDWARGRASKTLDRADTIAQEMPVLDQTVYAMEDAIKNRDMSFWSADNLAEVTGLEFFRTSQGAQLKSAIKTHFISDVKSMGARLNQYLEKQVMDASLKIGRSEEANEKVLESFKFAKEIKNDWLNNVRGLESYYIDNDLDLPANFNSRVDEMTKPLIEKRQKEYEKNIREIDKRERAKEKMGSKQNAPIKMKTPQGEEILVPENELEEALSLGAMRV